MVLLLGWTQPTTNLPVSKQQASYAFHFIFLMENFWGLEVRLTPKNSNFSDDGFYIQLEPSAGWCIGRDLQNPICLARQTRFLLYGLQLLYVLYCCNDMHIDGRTSTATVQRSGLNRLVPTGYHAIRIMWYKFRQGQVRAWSPDLLFSFLFGSLEFTNPLESRIYVLVSTYQYPIWSYRLSYHFTSL